MALKLLAVKVGALKKKSAASAIPAKLCASAFSLDSSLPGIEPGLNALAHRLGGMAEVADFFLRTPTLKASKFAAL